MRNTPLPFTNQRGVSLVEALVAFLVLSLGVLAMSRLQSHLRLHADISRQRSEAVRLAQEDLEASRTFSSMAVTKDGHSYADIVSASSDVTPGFGRAGNTSFHIDRHIAEGKGFRTASVAVDWPDRTGHDQRVVLHSVIAATPPALSGVLTLNKSTLPLKSLLGRSALIPATAKDLGNGSSAFKPSIAGTLTLVFDNISGLVTSRCQQAPGIRTADLSTTSLIDCTPMSGMLLSGIVRVSLTVPPDASRPSDMSLPLDVKLALTGSPASEAPICVSDQQERAVAYHCVIAGRWSGRSTLVPHGWIIGLTASDRKICRYSADQDASGAVDSNAEHPNEYKDVDRSLKQQNFLIVRGDQPCPVAAKSDAVFADISTVQHQP